MAQNKAVGNDTSGVTLALRPSRARVLVVWDGLGGVNVSVAGPVRH